MSQPFKSELKGFSLLLAIVLLVGLQFMSGCGGCGGDDENDADVTVEGDACPDVNKVTVDAYGVHYPCDICGTPVQSAVTNHSECGIGYAQGDIKGFREDIACNTTGVHTITYDNMKYGVNSNLGHSSYTYDLGAGVATFDNSPTNPPIDGCTTSGISACSPPFQSTYYRLTQYGVNIVWSCSSEEITDVAILSERYITNNKSAQGYGWEEQLDKVFARSFKCPDCQASGEWTYDDGSDRFIVIMRGVAPASGIEYCVYPNPNYDPTDPYSEAYLVSPAYARFSFEILTADASNNPITQIVPPTDIPLIPCN